MAKFAKGLTKKYILQKQKARICSLSLFLLLALSTALLFGCNTGALTQSSQEEPDKPPQDAKEEANPEEANPITQYFASFYTAYLPHIQALELFASASVEGLENTLALDLHMQRLQQLFLAFTKLGQGEGDGVWEGMLIGPFDGYGIIRRFGGQCVFSCTLQNRGEISGSLFRGKLLGEWLDEGREGRKGEITEDSGSYYALCIWEEQNSLLFIGENTLWFTSKFDKNVLPYGQPPESWADWGYINGELVNTGEFISANAQTEGE